MSNPAQPDHYSGLLQGIGQLLHSARQQAAQTYWHIGQHIVEFELFQIVGHCPTN